VHFLQLRSTGSTRATQSAHPLPYTLHPTPPPLLSEIPKTQRRLQWTLSQEDRVSRLESGLSEAREQARVQQNTLDHILRVLQGLQVPGALQAPPDPPPVQPAPPVATLVASATREPSHRLKPVAPNNFDGDHLKGQAFLNSCQLYISLCENQFWDDQAKIHWALSFMKSG